MLKEWISLVVCSLHWDLIYSQDLQNFFVFFFFLPFLREGCGRAAP